MAAFESTKSSSKSLSLSPKSGGKAITQYLPFLDWLVHYLSTHDAMNALGCA